MVSLHRRIPIFIGVWVQEKVRAIPAGRVGGVVVIDAVGVEELARVVGIIASFLQPERKVGAVEALRHKFRVSAYICGQQMTIEKIKGGDTIRWVDIGDVDVVCGFASQKTCS